MLFQSSSSSLFSQHFLLTFPHPLLCHVSLPFLPHLMLFTSCSPSFLPIILFFNLYCFLSSQFFVLPFPFANFHQILLHSFTSFTLYHLIFLPFSPLSPSFLSIMPFSSVSSPILSPFSPYPSCLSLFIVFHQLHVYLLILLLS